MYNHNKFTKDPAIKLNIKTSEKLIAILGDDQLLLTLPLIFSPIIIFYFTYLVEGFGILQIWLAVFKSTGILKTGTFQLWNEGTFLQEWCCHGSL